MVFRPLSAVFVAALLLAATYSDQTDPPNRGPLLQTTATATATLETTATPTATLDVTPTATATLLATATATTGPAFSCCEKNVDIIGGARPGGKAARVGDDATDVTIDIPLRLKWDCDEDASRQCFGFYEVTLDQKLSKPWEEQIAGGKWQGVGLASESIIPAAPLKVKCDGKKNHQGDWTFSYVARVKSGKKLRNQHLVFNLVVPPEKGTSYTLRFSVSTSGVNVDVHDVEFSRVKQKK